MPIGSLTKKSFNGGEWNPTLWHRSDLEEYGTANRLCLNFIPEIEGSICNRAGLRYAATTKASGASVARLEPFTFSTQQAYVLEFGNLYVRFFANSGQLVDGSSNPVEVTTPYVAADVALLKFEQSADVLYITHPSYPPATLSRTSPSTFVYAVDSFQPTQQPPTSLITSSPQSPPETGLGGVMGYQVTAVAADTEESIGSNLVYSVRGCQLTWTAPTGTAPDHYNIYEQNEGVFYYIGRTGSAVFDVPASPQTYVEQSPSIAITLFNSANNYPGCVAFYDQRLVFCRTNSQPQTLFGSKVGDFENMDYSSPTVATDAFQFTINSLQVNEIRWVMCLQAAIIGTSGGEWILQPATGSATVTPSSVSLTPQSSWGCSDIKPILVGKSLLFVDASLKAVRTLTYSVYINGYDGVDVSEDVKHLFHTYGITSWAFQQYPDSIIWAVRADGILLSLTYFEEAKVIGWARHQTQGNFESVASIGLPDGSKQVWFIVNRTVGGQSVRYVEYMDSRQFTTINDAFFVDAGLSYTGTSKTTFGGLNHLIGETVVALADGNVVTNLVVDNTGSITLPTAATEVHVGLPYTCQLQTLDFDTQVQGSALAALKREVVSVTLVLDNSREVFVGPDFSLLTEIPFRSSEQPGTAVQLFTGEKPDVTIKKSVSKRNTTVCLQTVNPLPLRVVALTANVSYGDR